MGIRPIVYTRDLGLREVPSMGVIQPVFTGVLEKSIALIYNVRAKVRCHSDIF